MSSPFDGLGIWVWTWLNDGIRDAQELIERCKEIGITTVFVKSHNDSGQTGDNVFWRDFMRTLGPLKAAGINVVAWGYPLPSSARACGAAAVEALNAGADGYVIDAEIEFEGCPRQAETMAALIKNAHPDKPLGYAPFPIIDLHMNYPYVEFNKYCDYVLPQMYWVSTRPHWTIERNFEQWDKWAVVWKGASFRVPKLRPIGPSYGGEYEGEYATFLAKLKDHGCAGVSFWRYGTMTGEEAQMLKTFARDLAPVDDSGASTRDLVLAKVNELRDVVAQLQSCVTFLDGHLGHIEEAARENDS